MINYRRKDQADCHRTMDIVDDKIKHLGYKSYDGRVVVDPVSFASIMSIKICRLMAVNVMVPDEDLKRLKQPLDELGFDITGTQVVTEHDSGDPYFSVKLNANIAADYGNSLKVKDRETLLKELGDALFAEIDKDTAYEYAMKIIR